MKKMNDKSNWNRLALQGIEIDDMDFVREFNLDPSIAYTPKINPELIRAMRDRNLSEGRRQGMPEDKVRYIANKNAKTVIAQINHLYKFLGLKERIPKHI